MPKFIERVEEDGLTFDLYFLSSYKVPIKKEGDVEEDFYCAEYQYNVVLGLTRLAMVQFYVADSKNLASIHHIEFDVAATGEKTIQRVLKYLNSHGIKTVYAEFDEFEEEESKVELDPFWH